MVLRRKCQLNSSKNAWPGQLASAVHTPGALQQSSFATQQNSMPSFASPQSRLLSMSSRQSYSSSSGSLDTEKWLNFIVLSIFLMLKNA